MTKFLRTYLKVIRIIIGIGVSIFLLFDCYLVINGETGFFVVFSVILEIGMLISLELIYRYFMGGIVYIKIGEKESVFVNLKGDEVIFDTIKVRKIINTTNWYKIYIHNHNTSLRAYKVLIKVTIEKNGVTHKNLCKYDFPMATME